MPAPGGLALVVWRARAGPAASPAAGRRGALGPGREEVGLAWAVRAVAVGLVGTGAQLGECFEEGGLRQLGRPRRGREGDHERAHIIWHSPEREVVLVLHRFFTSTVTRMIHSGCSVLPRVKRSEEH